MTSWSRALTLKALILGHHWLLQKIHQRLWAADALSRRMEEEQVFVDDSANVCALSMVVCGWGTQLSLSSAYHPQSDGQTMVVNRWIEGYLRCISGDRPKSWAQWLPMAEWWYNITFHISTGVTPHEALYGQSPPSHKYCTLGGTSAAVADALLQDRDAALRLLKEHLTHSQNRMK
ncbi:hypothetical protein RHSIM_Rhsim04G0120700 [Rhododendron simsii]|uniref:Integrase catalytic domain-containing protein n=1 Tax=Rhododendron simsii TaxID=118357 RepID=A0A834H546_RHOSS|nr:hypothetical protein RHSIM_Rhsim04G0120700 [Rhododendron simsii]